MVFLRTYFHLYRRERLLRVGFVTVLFLVLVPAIFPTGYFNWVNTWLEGSAASPASYATCFFNIKYAKESYDSCAAWANLNDTASDRPTFQVCLSVASGVPLGSTTGLLGMGVSMVLLSFNFFSVMIKLFPFSLNTIRIMKKIQKPSQNSLSSIYAKLFRLNESVFEQAEKALHLVWNLFVDIYASMLVEVSPFT